VDRSLDLGLFMIRVPNKKKKDFKTFMGLRFANNIYLKLI